MPDQLTPEGSTPRFWRGLDEIEPGGEHASNAQLDEFAEGASEWNDPIGRRRFLYLMGASSALAGLSGCLSGPPDPIVPYVEQPEQVVPGRPLFFATAVPIRGYAEPVLVESHTGRPTKIEGNPAHPASRGATSAQAQAAILDLYDPDRSQTVRFRGDIATWEGFVEALRPLRARWSATGGAGLRILTGPITSPTLAAQLELLLRAFPAARWHVHDPSDAGFARAGLRQALGRAAEARYHFDRARVVLTLDADVVLGQPGSVRYARDLAARRQVRQGQTEMSRLYAAETTPTLTGAFADERLRLHPDEREAFLQALAARLDAGAGGAVLSPEAQAWAAAVATDLRSNRGAAVVVAGETLSPDLHALAYRLNEALGAVGTTVTYGEPVVAEPSDASADPGHGLAVLVDEMAADRVEALVMLGTNPAYTAPADVAFSDALRHVEMTVHLGSHVDETGFQSVWHLPEAHPLEAWSDARAYDGTVTLIQPLIAPLYDGHSVHEVVAVLTHGVPTPGYDLVRGFWRRAREGQGDFETFWHQALRDGFVAGMAGDGSSAGRNELRPYEAVGAAAGSSPTEPDSPPSTPFSLLLRPDPTIGTGEWANNGWLQETPKPLTKLVWDNAALLSPRTARDLEVANGDVVELRYRNRAIEAPVWVLPGQPDGCVTCHLGYGRTYAGRAGTGAGFDAYPLRFTDAPWGGPGLEVRKTGKTHPLASTQEQGRMHGREIVRAAPLSHFVRNPDFAHEGEMRELPTLYPGYEYNGYKWGMSIDLTACTGCNACVVACVAENNVPVVGKEEVRRGRHMHWLRIDRYYTGDADAPDGVAHQPVLCQHCENAPCEVVCPVNATVHDSEGLNVMVYNRCMGTRYCSNNCPYKVRRFNFLQYTDLDRGSVTALRHNPDVTVRTRGVMEKCTFCVQRISHARIEAKKENRPIRDGEVVTACQGACPTEAIVFGDLNDPAARVSRLKAEPHTYGLLAELGTRPRTTYLARISNPNPALHGAPGDGGAS